MKTMRATMALRVVQYPPDIYGRGQQQLQQAWECMEDGSVEWRDVEVVGPEIFTKPQNIHRTTGHKNSEF